MSITKNEEKEIKAFLSAGKSINEAIVKKIILENQELKEEIRKMQELIPSYLNKFDAEPIERELREARQKLNDKFINILAKKNIPMHFARGHAINKEDDIFKAMAEIEAAYKAKSST